MARSEATRSASGSLPDWPAAGSPWILRMRSATRVCCRIWLSMTKPNTKQYEQEEAAAQEQRPGHDRLRRIMERITIMPVVSDTTASPKILRPPGSVNSTPM